MRRFLLFALLLIVAVPGWACSCTGHGGCRPVGHQDTLFLGKVLSRDSITLPPGTNGIPFAIQKNLFRIVVIETFAGLQKVGESITIETGNGGGNCGYPFRVGDTYLVDAYSAKESIQGYLGTGICSLTGPEVVRMPELRQLRAWAAHQPLPTLTGTVGVSAGGGFADEAHFRPLPDIALVVTGAGSRPATQVKTDAQGVYTVPYLAPGKYTIEPRLPANLSTWQTEIEQKPFEVTIPDAAPSSGSDAATQDRGSADQVACVQSIDVLPSGSISGRVTDPEGRPVRGFLSTENVDNSGAGQGASGETETDGTFTLHFLPNGNYRLTLVLNNNFQKPWYYPGTFDRTQAQVLSLDDGEHREDVRVLYVPEHSLP